MNEKLVLQLNPFEGDMGSSGDRTLRKQMVTCRKERECGWCFQNTKKGTRIRVQIEIFDGGMQDYVWCNDCCKAMEKDIKTGGYDATEKRIELGYKQQKEAGSE